MRLAVLIIGSQNSGKTSTIKFLINTYASKSLKVMRAGWKSIFLSKILKALRINFYCVPASPTETKIKLSVRFLTMIPEFLIVAEQVGGNNYSDTMSFLNSNGYTVLRYDISNADGASDWERYDKNSEELKLQNRANQIISDIKNFIKANGII